jgi:hypothetical protein
VKGEKADGMQGPDRYVVHCRGRSVVVCVWFVGVSWAWPL